MKIEKENIEIANLSQTCGKKIQIYMVLDDQPGLGKNLKDLKLLIVTRVIEAEVIERIVKKGMHLINKSDQFFVSNAIPFAKL